MLKLALAALISFVCLSTAFANPPKSLSEPLDDNYSNGCNDPGYAGATDSNGVTGCYNTSNGRPQP